MASSRQQLPARPAQSNLVKYAPWTPEAAEEEAEAVAAASESGGYWKPKAGRSVIRILPAVLTRPMHPKPMVVTWNHYIELPGEEKGVGFNCPRKHKAGWTCPACVKFEELRATGNPADWKAAGEFMPKLRVYANIIDRDDEGSGPQVFAFGKTIYEPLMSYRSTNPNEDTPFHLPDENGCDILIDKKGEKKNTKYSVRLARNCSVLHEDAKQVEEWLEVMRDLRGEARVMSTREIVALLSGEDVDGDRGGRGGGRPGRPSPAGGGGRPAPGRPGHARSVSDDLVDADPDEVEAEPGYQLHDDD